MLGERTREMGKVELQSMQERQERHTSIVK